MTGLRDNQYVLTALLRDLRFGVVTVFVVAPGVALVALLLSFAALAQWRPPSADRRVVYVDQTVRGSVIGISHETIGAFRTLRDVFERVAYRSEDRGRSPDAGSSIWLGEMVSGEYFEVLGLQAALGRSLDSSDDSPSASRTVVISQRLWRDQFASDQEVLGKPLRIGLALTGLRSEPAPSYTVVGVMPEFASRIASPFRPVDYWVPATVRAADYACERDLIAQSPFTAVAALAEGVTLTQAEAATGSVWRSILERKSPDLLVGRAIRLSSTPSFALPFDRTRIGAVRLGMLALGLAAVVSVATLTSLTGLLMLRAIRRRPSDAIRIALGGGPWLASRAVLIEGLVVGVVAGVVALLLLYATSEVLSAVFPLPTDSWVTPNLWGGRRSDGWLLVASVCFGLLAGLLPAYHCRPAALGNTLANQSAQAPRLRNQALVIIPQVTLATATLMVAATIGVGVMKEEVAVPGYDVDRLTFARFVLPGPARCHQSPLALAAAARDRRTTSQRILSTLDESGLGKSAASSGTPFDPLTNWIVSADAEDRGRFRVAETSVSAKYGEVLGLTLLSGRFFDGSESPDGSLVAVVSAAIAEYMWNGNALGQRFAFSNPSSTTRPTEWMTVIGVVNDVSTPLAEGELTPWVYTSLSQRSGAVFALVRDPITAGSVTQTLRATVTRANNKLVLLETASVASHISTSRYPRRLSAMVLATCCLLTAWLACVGLYGLMSYATLRRLHDFAVCIALGAERSRIHWMALRGGLTYAAVGITVGLVLGAAAIAFMSRVISDMPSLSVAAAVVVTLVLALVLALASVGPTRLVASVDTIRLLRQE